MATSKSHSHESGQSAKENAEPGVSAIQRQKALEAAYGTKPLAQAASPQPESVKAGSRKIGWLAVIGLLVLVLLVLLRYPDILSRLEGKLVPVDSQPQENVLLQQQLATARDLAANLLDKPESLGQLVALYRTVLQRFPNQSQALSGLDGLPEQCITILSFYIATGQWDIAKQLADESPRYLPGLAGDARWQRLLNNIPAPALQQSPDIEITATIEQEPIDDAVAASIQPMQAAKEEVNSAAVPEQQTDLPIQGEETPLPETQERFVDAPREDQLSPVDTLETEPEENIQRLLGEAREFSQQGIKFTQQENAVTRYRDVLTLKPNQIEASEELRKLIDARAVYVESLMAEGEQAKARIFLEQALEYFPADARLQTLSREIAQGGGSISLLAIDFMQEQEVDTGFAAAGGKVLLLSFNYKYFPPTTTVVNARLFTYPELEPIADVPILIREQRGSMSIQLSTLDRNILEGRYQLTLSLADKNLIKHEFAVADGNIIDGQPQ